MKEGQETREDHVDVRTEAVAGLFYPNTKEKITNKLNSFFKTLPKENKTSCIIAPHAGYDYSGQTAAIAFNALKKAPCFVILSPSHTGLGEAISVSAADSWQTPLGTIPVDKKAREELLEKLGIEADGVAHVQEHSIEVQLPFLQHQFKEFTILPVTIMAQDLEKLKELGNALAELKANISVIASGDFTHHEPLETAKEKDLKAIEKIKKLDLEGFYEMVVGQNMSICGLAPITALIQYCKKKEFKQGKLLKYDTSATSTEESSNVVGYAAIKFE